jgi:hypothetical protein
MKGLTRRTLIGTAVVALAVAFGGPAAASPGARPPARGAAYLPSTPASPAIEPRTVGQRIKNGDGDATGKCLDVISPGAGGEVQVIKCNGSVQQNWNYVGRPDIANGVYEIRSRVPAIDPICVNGYVGQGSQVYVSSCGVSYTLWRVRPIAPGWNQWENFFNVGECLDVRDFGKSNVVQLWACTSNPATRGNQMWQVF